MKCRACWADKAYVRHVAGWRGAALSLLGLMPLKCHHCYHRFTTLRLLTIGQVLTPPSRKAGGPVPQLSIAGRGIDAGRDADAEAGMSQPASRRRAA